MAKLFDSHCHLDDPSYADDRDEVLERAKKAGVAACMVVGTTLKSSKKAAELAQQKESLYASVGVHPHDAAQCTEADMAGLRRIAQSNPKVRAWGETGLDFNRMYSPQEDQEKWFERQIAEAREAGLAMIFHERDSKGRFYEMLQSCFADSQKGVVHCFSGNRAELSAYLDMGLYVGITGVLTQKTRGEALRDLVRHIPDNRMLIETDAPYLTPAPERNRFRRNEPAFVKSVFETLVALKNREPADLAAVLWDNTCRLFDIRAVPA